METQAAPPVSPPVGGRVRREDLPAAKMRDLTFDKETPDMLHPITPQDVGRISGEGRPEMKLQDCWAKPAPENRLHFKLLGEVTSNDGMIHFGLNVPLDQLVSNLAMYCKLPKLVVSYLDKQHEEAGAGKPLARWRGDKSVNNVSPRSTSSTPLPGETGELKYIYHTLARRCKLLLDETNDLYHLLMGPLNHNHEIEERWTSSKTSKVHSAESYHRRYTTFPDRPLVPRETEPILDPNCTGNNPVGDPFKIQTWERIFLEQIKYNRKWLPLRKNEEGKCVVDEDMWNQVQLLHHSLSQKHKAWFGSEDDWEDRKKRAKVKVKRGRRRRRSSDSSSARYFVNHLAHSAERFKRFVMAMFFAVVAIGSLLFSAVQMDHMAAKANHNRDETVRLFNKDEHAIRVHDEAIRSMNESIQALNKAVDASFGHIETLQLTLKTYAAMDSYFSEHTRILRGLSSLLRHRLSPDLIHSKALGASVKLQQEKFLKMGYKIGLESLDDIFRAPTSWIMYGNASLFVATHLPVYRTSTRFKLLQPDKTMYFAPPPPSEGTGDTAEATDDYAFTVEGEADLLAVSQDGRYYQTLNWAQLTECSRVGTLYVCPNSNVLQKTETELSSCLVALYKGKIDQIRKLCRHRSVKRADYALQISGNRFLVRVGKPTLVKFKCSGQNRDERAQVKAQTINDTALVQVAGMCSAACGDFVLHGRLEFSAQTTAYESQSLEVSDLFPALIKDDQMVDWERFKAFRVTYNPDGVPFEDVGKRFMKFDEDTTWDWVTWILTLCCIAGIVILTIFVLIRWGPKMKDKMRNISEKRDASRGAAAQQAFRLQKMAKPGSTPSPARKILPGSDDNEAGLELLSAYDALGENEIRAQGGARVGTSSVAYDRQPPYRPTPSISKIDQEIKRQEKMNRLAQLKLDEQALERASDPSYQDAVRSVLDTHGIPRSKSVSGMDATAPSAAGAMKSSSSVGKLSGGSGASETGLSASANYRNERLNTLAFAVSTPSLEALLTANPDLNFLRFKDDESELKRGWPLVIKASKSGQPLHGLYREEVQAALNHLDEDGNHGVTQRQAIHTVLDRRRRARKYDDVYQILDRLFTVIKQSTDPRVRIDALMFPKRPITK